MKNTKANELQTDLDVYGNSPHIYYTPNVQHHFTVSFTRDIEQPEFYDSVIHLLLTAEEGTTINFLISSYGGHLDSLLSLRGALQATRADVTGYLMAQAASAAGMLLLCCHNFVMEVMVKGMMLNNKSITLQSKQSVLCEAFMTKFFQKMSRIY